MLCIKVVALSNRDLLAILFLFLHNYLGSYDLYISSVLSFLPFLQDLGFEFCNEFNDEHVSFSIHQIFSCCPVRV